MQYTGNVSIHSLQRLYNFLFSELCQPALETTQPYTQWEERSISVGLRRLEHEANDSQPKTTAPHIPRDFKGKFLYFLLTIL